MRSAFTVRTPPLTTCRPIRGYCRSYSLTTAGNCPGVNCAVWGNHVGVIAADASDLAVVHSLARTALIGSWQNRRPDFDRARLMPASYRFHHMIPHSFFDLTARKPVLETALALLVLFGGGLGGSFASQRGCAQAEARTCCSPTSGPASPGPTVYAHCLFLGTQILISWAARQSPADQRRHFALIRRMPSIGHSASRNWNLVCRAYRRLQMDHAVDCAAATPGEGFLLNLRHPPGTPSAMARASAAKPLSYFVP